MESLESLEILWELNTPLKRKYLKLQFDTVRQLMRVRNDLLHVVEKNEEKLDAMEAFETIHGVKRCL